jgi:NADH-quinone oxidoreductase subunit J
MLYGLFALGAVGVYLALPGGRRSAGRAGLIFGLAAIAGFVTLAATRFLGDSASALAFCLLAAVAVFGAGKVITHTKPVYSALYLILVVVAIACLMVLQQAEFLGIALIIVYAGAILVTYVFVIMLAQQSGASMVDLRAREPLMAVLVGFVTMAVIAAHATALPTGGASAGGPVVAAVAAEAATGADPRGSNPFADSNTASVGFALLTQYVVALEIAGVLLLVAMIGAIAMAKKRVPQDVPAAAPPPAGQIGKEVPPF